MKFKPNCVADEELMKIPVKEANEKLVNLRDYNKDIIIEIEEESKKAQNLKENECFVRESVAIMLSQVQSLLPKGICLKIIDCYRPMEAQKRIYAQVFSELKNKLPNLTDKELEKETDKWVANPKIIPPHTTGGAVDLILVDKNLKELTFGTKINAVSIKAATEFPFKNEIKNNRLFLIKIMTEAGFVNYPLEYWHWSYGDRIWAFYKKKHFAIYDSI
ncbi:M15 family metallopeptidase [Candidatus Woesearchaeota archaeon]|nr:M15 family metallopeptidase [Candidatus Woesearchaeota archaeon]MBI4159435.1 M15 family metallopeptidase [Candidatus Woesearchaeota archaeon]